MRLIIVLLTLAVTFGAHATSFPGSWNAAKNRMDDEVYYDNRTTIYCGCEYTSDNDSDGSGDIDASVCGLDGVALKKNVKDTIQWEHIVPASLMPVGGYMCWQKESEVKACIRSNGDVKYKNRECCQRVSPSGKMMIFDMFNLAPAAAQLNQYRTNDPYGEIPDNVTHEGFGAKCEARDLNGTTSGAGGLFEPPDCKKGDVARTWFYMRLAHGVIIDADTEAMFERWSQNDPVSPWEKTRHDRIAEIQGNKNPYVDGIIPDRAGSCPWEPD